MLVFFCVHHMIRCMASGWKPDSDRRMERWWAGGAHNWGWPHRRLAWASQFARSTKMVLFRPSPAGPASDRGRRSPPVQLRVRSQSGGRRGRHRLPVPGRDQRPRDREQLVPVYAPEPWRQPLCFRQPEVPSPQLPHWCNRAHIPASRRWASQLPFIRVLCAASHFRCNWVIAYLCASYGLFPLGCCDHTYTHYLLITAQPNGKPWKWGLFSCCMNRHWKAATGGSWKFVDNQC